MKVGSIVQEPLDIFEPSLGDLEKRRLVRETLQKVGLPPDSADRYPHQFSAVSVSGSASRAPSS